MTKATKIAKTLDKNAKVRSGVKKPDTVASLRREVANLKRLLDESQAEWHSYRLDASEAKASRDQWLDYYNKLNGKHANAIRLPFGYCLVKR